MKHGLTHTGQALYCQAVFLASFDHFLLLDLGSIHNPQAYYPPTF